VSDEWCFTRSSSGSLHHESTRTLRPRRSGRIETPCLQRPSHPLERR